MKCILREVQINLFLSAMKGNDFTVKVVDFFFPKQADMEDPLSVIGIYMVMEYHSLTLFDIITLTEKKLNRE